MPQYLLRIEGVNIYATVEDTNQLSVQRGSSLLLRQAIKDTDNKIHGLQSISTGASVGIFQFAATNGQKAKKIRDDIANYLNIDNNYRHLTFVVDVVAVQGNDFAGAKEAVLALNRFRQFQQATLVFPSKNESKEIAPCAWDNLRPADGPVLSKVKRDDIGYAKISSSAGDRHNFGRSQKQAFIKAETATNNQAGLDYHYTNDLQEIAATNQPHLRSLNDKLAVLYFDGNGFSNIQKNLGCDQLKAFDENIQEKRKAWLRKLVETIQKDSDFKTCLERKKKNTKEFVKIDAIRLEILLWGGDELMLAVPAWKGMEVLQHFYDFHKDWTYPEGNEIKENKDKKYLTHAGSLVLCHVKTPIQRIKKLAREIADHIKDEYLGEPKAGKIDKYKLDANLYDYVVLESIDYPTQSWGSFLTKRYTQAVAKNRQPQRPLYDNYDAQRKKFRELTENLLPRRQLYRLVNSLINPDQKLAEAHQRFSDVVDNAAELEKTVKQLFPGTDPNLHWLHLLDLWDYFAPPNAPSVQDSDRKEATS